MYFDNQPIITDFNRFVDYLNEAGTLELTRIGAKLRASDLLVLNERMQQPVLIEKNKPTQKDFILLTAFYHIGLAAELWLIRRTTKGAFNLIPQPARIALYDGMNNDERYGFLLQTFWCYFDAQTAFDDRSFWGRSTFFQTINVKVEPKTTLQPVWVPKYFLTILAAFGMIDFSIDESQKENSTYYKLKNMTITETGQKFLPILGSSRLNIYWVSLDPKMTKDLYLRLYEEPEDIHTLPEFSDFFAEFKSVYPEWEVEKRLFPIERPIALGTFTVKISLSAKCYRVITVHSKSTLDELHLIIQKLFHFDNDHLYAFYLDGNQYSNIKGNVFLEPHASYDLDGYPADILSLGELGLYMGQSILYLFDFGDNWEFMIEIMDFSSSNHENKTDYQLIASVGEAPKQYAHD